MRIHWYIILLSSLILSCSSHGASETEDNPSPGIPEDTQNHETDTLTAEYPEITLFYDTPRVMRLFYKKGVELKVAKANNCIDILTDSLVTNAYGVAHLEMKARLYNCDNGKTVTVCDAQDDQMCTEFTVRTTSDPDILDTNGNLMIDVYETNTDKEKDTFPNHPEGCTSYCHDDSDCKDFCDSAIGYRCSTRCTSDDQCLKISDDEDDDKWISMKCRADTDGRCAYPSFKVIYSISKDNTTVTMGGHPADGNATINWGDDTGVQNIPANTENNLSHVYAKSGQYIVEITGDYRDWTAGCSVNNGIDIKDVLQFGTIGLGYVGNMEDIDQGSFTNCQNFKKISAKDIPDAVKMTNMNAMFAGHENGGIKMYFDDPAVSRWDTSHVTSMYHTFMNNGDGDISAHPGFKQDLSKWNVSSVRSMNGMFWGAVNFNSNIRCWDTSSVEDISFMFHDATSFNQNLDIWNLNNVTKHDCTFRWENGHNGDISLKNYCILRSRVNNENIGRDGVNDCPSMKPFGRADYGSACCGIAGSQNVDRNKYDILCDPGYDYGPACDGFSSGETTYNWKTVVDECLDRYLHKQKKFEDLTEDDVTCHHLRICRECYYKCHLCYDECKETDRSKCDCQCEFDRQINSNGKEVIYYQPCDGMDTPK